MKTRIELQHAHPKLMQALLAIESHLHGSSLGSRLQHLVKTRASQINGCAFCLDMHTKDARAEGESEQRLYALDAWRETPFFDERERAALEWTEAVTRVAESHVPDEVYERLRQHFSEQEVSNDSLAWIDSHGNSVTESQLAVLKAAACTSDTPPAPRLSNHHELVEKGVRYMVQEEKSIGGQLGRRSGARYRVYEVLKTYASHVEGSLFATQELAKAIDQIYRYPLQQAAADALNRQLKLGLTDQQLADFVVSLWQQDRLCRVEEESGSQEPQIICSLGLSSKG